MKKTRIKIVHLPTTVGGNPQGISRGLRELGIESETWTLHQNCYAYPADKVIYKRNDFWLVKEIKRLFALKYVFVFDVIFFNNANTLFTRYPPRKKDNCYFCYLLKYLIFHVSKFMQTIEIFLIKIQGKKVFVQFQGDDIRLADFCLKHFELSAPHFVDRSYYTKEGDDFRRYQIKFFDKYADKLYALNPDLLHILPKRTEFLPYCHINPRKIIPIYSQNENRPLRIGHAPSNRLVKGTPFIIEALNSLKNDGYEFEFILVEGLSNEKAMEIYKTFDILIDQLLIGWYGVLAVECMALGKPVIVYLREEDLKFIPPEMQIDLPFINANPSNICEVLRKVLEMPRNELIKIAKKSRLFVEKWHNPLRIAEKVASDIKILSKHKYIND